MKRMQLYSVVAEYTYMMMIVDSTEHFVYDPLMGVNSDKCIIRKKKYDLVFLDNLYSRSQTEKI